MDYKFIQVKKIADSVTLLHNDRLTTFELTYPRLIHSELMTHRVFSRNAQSSRAIPTPKRIARILEDPVVPLVLYKNQKGMQAKSEEVDKPIFTKDTWIAAARASADAADILYNTCNLHKQWSSRGLEPYDTITTIVTATDFENFFALRCADDAQPEICRLAWLMADEYYAGTKPVPVVVGHWHLPYIETVRIQAITEYHKANPHLKLSWDDIAIRSSIACCARVSYLNHDGSNIDIEKDLGLYAMLKSSMHMSPFEHVATPSLQMERTSNFKGWTQYRKLLDKEVLTFNYEEALKTRQEYTK